MSDVNSFGHLERTNANNIMGSPINESPRAFYLLGQYSHNSNRVMFLWVREQGQKQVPIRSEQALKNKANIILGVLLGGCYYTSQNSQIVNIRYIMPLLEPREQLRYRPEMMFEGQGTNGIEGRWSALRYICCIGVQYLFRINPLK